MKDSFENWLEMLIDLNNSSEKELIEEGMLPHKEYFKGKIYAYENALKHYRQFKQAEPCKP